MISLSPTVVKQGELIDPFAHMLQSWFSMATSGKSCSYHRTPHGNDTFFAVSFGIAFIRFMKAWKLMAGTPAQNKEGKIESDERNLFLTLGCLGRMTFEKHHPPFLVYHFRTMLFFNHHLSIFIQLGILGLWNLSIGSIPGWLDGKLGNKLPCNSLKLTASNGWKMEDDPFGMVPFLKVVCC